MANERRVFSKLAVKPSPLPDDYLKMVRELLTTHFDDGLKAIAKLRGRSRFEALGAIYPDEVILSVSLVHEKGIAATTAHASCDFDRKASAPTVQDLLGACVDGVGAVFEKILDPKDQDGLERLADESLSALENVPLDWTRTDISNRNVYLKVDKANLKLDKMADDWLAKNDPENERRLEAEREEMEKLFVTGPSKGTKKGDLH